MVVVKFPDRKTTVHALGFLLGRLSGRVFRSGEVIAPTVALEGLALEGFSFTVLGQATYELMVLPGSLLSKRRVLPWKNPSSA